MLGPISGCAVDALRGFALPALTHVRVASPRRPAAAATAGAAAAAAAAAGGPSAARAAKPAKTLDTLFRKTVTTPAIYFLPVSQAQVDARRARLASAAAEGAAGAGAADKAV
jgi:hypothetical protein